MNAEECVAIIIKIHNCKAYREKFYQIIKSKYENDKSSSLSSESHGNNKEKKIITFIPEHKIYFAKCQRSNNYEFIIMCNNLKNVSSGSYGVVKNAINLKTGAKLVVKIQNYDETAKREIAAMQVLGIEFFLAQSPRECYIFQNYLGERLELLPDLNFSDLLSILFQIVNSLQKFHSAGLIHGDVNIRNILFRTYITYGSINIGDKILSQEQLNFVVGFCDFGLSFTVGREIGFSFTKGQVRKIPTNILKFATPTYIEKYKRPETYATAPEFFRKDSIVSPLYDVWSLAFIIDYLFNVKLRIIEKYTSYKNWNAAHNIIFQLKERCCNYNPKYRPTLDEITSELNAANSLYNSCLYRNT